MKKLIIVLLSVNKKLSLHELLFQVNKQHKITDRGLRQALLRYKMQGVPIASGLDGYSLIKSWKEWEKADKFLLSYIKDFQKVRTRLKKNVGNYLINPKLLTA